MYTSLDRIDIVLGEGDGDVAVQTDHRGPAQIEAEWDRAVVFALTRALNPPRGGSPRVRFLFTQAPPPAFVALLTTAGAEVEVMHGARHAATPDDAATDRAAAEALHRLGAQVLAHHGVDDAAGLEEMEARYAEALAESISPASDELAHWSAVIELGAAVGELLHRLHGFDWVRDPGHNGTPPWMMAREGNLANVFGKVERYFARGPCDAPSQLLTILAEDPSAEGRVVFNLRAPTWTEAERCWHRPLLEGIEGDAMAEVPCVTLVRDQPTTIATIRVFDDAAEQAACEAEARANLAALTVEVDRLDDGVLMVHGDLYAAEKVLDEGFMAGMQLELDSPLLLVGLPVKGLMLVTAMTRDRAAMATFGANVRRLHDQGNHRERLSPALFLYAEDTLGGIVRSVPGRAKRKGLWARLLGRD